MKLSSGITIVLLLTFAYFAWNGGVFDVMATWDGQTWALMALIALVAWVSRNEFGGL